MEIKKQTGKKQTAKKQTAKELQDEVKGLVKKLRFDDGGLLEGESLVTAKAIRQKLNEYYQGNFSLWSNFNELWVAVCKQAESSLSAVHTIIMNATVAPYWSKVKKGMLTALRIENEKIKKNLQIIYENETAPKNRIKGQAPKQNLQYIENIKEKIKDVIQRLRFGNDVRCLMATSKLDVRYVYNYLNIYYKFNPTDRDFCKLWNNVHKMYLVKPNETNSQLTTQIGITWNAIFNATVDELWCKKSEGMIPLLRRTDLKEAFEPIYKEEKEKEKEKKETEFFKTNFNKSLIPDRGSLTGDD